MARSWSHLEASWLVSSGGCWMEARIYMDSLSVWAFMKARVSLPCRVSGSLQNKVKYGTSPHKLMVKVVFVASPDLRGADVGGVIREEEEVSCSGVGNSVLTERRHK